MPNTKEILEHLKKNVYCRLKPSSIHGVGVFAIRDIPAGTNPFEEIVSSHPKPWIPVPKKDVFDNPEILDEVKDMVRAFFTTEGDVVYLPPCSLNEITIDCFCNHSDNPNLEWHEDACVFISKRPIAAGEELTSDYRTYSEE